MIKDPLIDYIAEIYAEEDKKLKMNHLISSLVD